VSTYQPLWIDGQTVGESIRDAEGRYMMIRECLEGLVKPGFTLLDVGAQSGYFSVRMADEMGARATAVDCEPILLEGLAEMGPHNVAGVMKMLQPRDLKIFRPVDVGLCLSVLHHVTWWETMIDELMGMCRILFVECAMPGEQIAKDHGLLDEQHRAVAGLPGATLAGWTPGFDARVERPMYMIPGRR
jgi:2-polyprenyl-3-methyl-5-hydroxy-6-metoxy-1,4-benzoquinol methylase